MIDDQHIHQIEVFLVPLKNIKIKKKKNETNLIGLIFFKCIRKNLKKYYIFIKNINKEKSQRNELPCLCKGNILVGNAYVISVDWFDSFL